MSNQETVRFSATQVLDDNNNPREAEKGRKLYLELQDREEWFPKSQLTQVDETEWEIPSWLAKEKDIAA